MKWISVKQRLPKKHDDYLVTDGFACMVAAYETDLKEWNFFGLNFWHTTEVTHWMELPQVPKIKK